MMPSMIHHPAVYQHDYTFVILLTCIFVGVLLGLGGMFCVVKVLWQPMIPR
jgi:hypothetical protein